MIDVSPRISPWSIGGSPESHGVAHNDISAHIVAKREEIWVLEAHLGVLKAHLEPWRFTLELWMLTLVTWRLTQTSWRSTLEILGSIWNVEPNLETWIIDAHPGDLEAHPWALDTRPGAAKLITKGIAASTGDSMITLETWRLTLVHRDSPWNYGSSPWSLRDSPGSHETLPRAMETHLGAMEAYPEVIKSHHRAIEAHPGAM